MMENLEKEISRVKAENRKLNRLIKSYEKEGDIKDKLFL